MASRQEEKERRRQERLAAEQAAQRAQARRKRIQLALGALLALALVAGIVVAVLSAGGGDDGGGEGESGGITAPAGVTLPPPEEGDLDKAAEAAGCDLVHAKYEGAGHDPEKDFQPSDYQTNPPTSGTHSNTWYEDGIYDPGNVPELGKLVHTLEHGRINLQYKPGTSKQIVDQLQAFAAESNEGYHLLIYENTTEMPYQIAATAWTQLLGCNEVNDKTWDALRTFTSRYIDQGPEKVP